MGGLELHSVLLSISCGASAALPRWLHYRDALTRGTQRSSSQEVPTAVQVEQQLAALDRELGKTRMAQASEQATVNEAVDDLDNLKSTLVAAKRTLKQQEASCAAARCWACARSPGQQHHACCIMAHHSQRMHCVTHRLLSRLGSRNNCLLGILALRKAEIAKVVLWLCCPVPMHASSNQMLQAYQLPTK